MYESNTSQTSLDGGNEKLRTSRRSSLPQRRLVGNFQKEDWGLNMLFLERLDLSRGKAGRGSTECKKNCISSRKSRGHQKDHRLWAKARSKCKAAKWKTFVVRKIQMNAMPSVLKSIHPSVRQSSTCSGVSSLSRQTQSATCWGPRAFPDQLRYKKFIFKTVSQNVRTDKPVVKLPHKSKVQT